MFFHFLVALASKCSVFLKEQLGEVAPTSSTLLFFCGVVVFDAVLFLFGAL